MYLDTMLAIKAAIIADGPIKDALGRECIYSWARPDPRNVLPETLRQEADTHISVEVTAITKNPQLSRFPLKIGFPMISNGKRISREEDHPEPKLIQLQVHVRSEGRLPEANLWTAGQEIQRRLRHKDHLKVPVDVYRDQQQFLVPSQVLVTGEVLNRPDGIVRKEFSFDISYTVETWLLFPRTRQDVPIVEQVNLAFYQQEPNVLYETAVINTK